MAKFTAAALFHELILKHTQAPGTGRVESHSNWIAQFSQSQVQRMNENKQSLTSSFSNSGRTGDASPCATARLLRLPEVIKVSDCDVPASINMYGKAGSLNRYELLNGVSDGWKRRSRLG
jgi:hypothetical protein